MSSNELYKRHCQKAYVVYQENRNLATIHDKKPYFPVDISSIPYFMLTIVDITEEKQDVVITKVENDGIEYRIITPYSDNKIKGVPPNGWFFRSKPQAMAWHSILKIFIPEEHLIEK